MGERRKYQRYKVSHRVTYRDSSQAYKLRREGESETVDVSRGGVRIKLNNLITKGKILNLKIYNASYNEPVNVDAKVVWVKEAAGDSFVLGLAFTNIGWIESDRLFKP